MDFNNDLHDQAADAHAGTRRWKRANSYSTRGPLPRRRRVTGRAGSTPAWAPCCGGLLVMVVAGAPKPSTSRTSRHLLPVPGSAAGKAEEGEQEGGRGVHPDAAGPGPESGPGAAAGYKPQCGTPARCRRGAAPGAGVVGGLTAFYVTQIIQACDDRGMGRWSPTTTGAQAFPSPARHWRAAATTPPRRLVSR